MLIKQVHQKNVVFVTFDILKILVLSMTHTSLATSVFYTRIFAMVVQKLRSHDLAQKAMSFNDVAIVYVKRSDCRIQFW